MAEARQAVAFQFAVTEEGIQVHFDRSAIKYAVKALVALSKARYLRVKNALLSGIFPASPLSLAVLGGVAYGSAALGRDFTFGVNRAVTNFLGRYGYHGNSSFYVVLGCEALLGWLAWSYLQGYMLKALLCYRGWMFDPHGQRSLKTRVWGVAMQALTTLSPSPQLYSYQPILPRLPVPALEDTCRRYLESVRPLMSDQEFEVMEQLVKDFKNGAGKKMQRYLVVKSWWASNYVTDWWESYVYLHGRSSLMINSNYYGCDSLNSARLTTNPVARAALASHVMMKMKREVDMGVLKPLVVMGLVPLCSAQYERLFNTTRIPGNTVDRLQHYTGPGSEYCVCCHDGQWFKVPLASPQGRIYTPAELEHQYQMIWEGKWEEPGPGERALPALTAMGRTEWAETRQKYFGEGVNKVSVEIIDKAAFMLMFDEKCYDDVIKDDEGMTAYCKDLLHGTGTSRWFDKSFTLVIYANGKLGVNAEHAWADAPIVGYMLEYSCNLENIITFQPDGHCWGYNDPCKPLPPPTRLQWQFPRECVSLIESAQLTAEQSIADLDLYVLIHDEFGKGVMKKSKISPDAFIQMALQMAYYKDAGKFCLTYEASMTRLYLLGRTETVRPVSKQSTQFVKAMCDPSNLSKEEKKRLLVEATDHHAHSYKMAMVGEGIDRHLFCLYVMSKYLKIDSPFLSKVLHEPWRLSTSQTPSQQTGRVDFDSSPERISGGGGFGPVAKDGYGVSYIIQGNSTMFFHVSAFKSCPNTNAKKFAGLIKESLAEMRDICS